MVTFQWLPAILDAPGPRGIRLALMAEVSERVGGECQDIAQ